MKTLLVIFASALLAHGNPNAPTSVRYSVDSTMAATAIDSNASGRVQAFLRKNGPSDQYRLRLTAAGLDARTSYTVLAQIGDDPTLVPVTNFTTTAHGTGRVVYVSAHGANTKRALPETMAPVTTVRSLAVATANGDVVLTVDLHEADSMKFELTSIFDNTGTDAMAIGCVAVAIQNNSVQFRMFAAGGSSQLTFCVNGNPVQTYNTDPTGRLSVGLFPATAPSPLDFRNLSLRNNVDAVVLQSDVR